MAAAVTNALAQKWGKENALYACSAGLFANEGEPIASNAVLALERAGIDPTERADYRAHTAHTLRADEARKYDLLIGVSSSHAMQLLMCFPQCAHAITCLPNDISDPYGGDEETYRVCLAEITRGVESLLFTGGNA